MKIGYVTPEFVTEKNRGGQAAYLENISRIFSKHGHEVVIVVLSDHNEEFIWKDGITVCRVEFREATPAEQINKYALLKKMFHIFWAYAGVSLVLNRKTKKLIKDKKIEIAQYSSLRALPLFMSRKIPSVIRLSAHPIYCRYAQEEYFDINEAENNLSLSEKIWLFSLKRADFIFGPSKMVGSAVEKKIKKKVEIIESPLSSDLNVMDKHIYCRYLEGKKYMLFFGTLNYLKGIQTIAPILDEFLDKYKEMYFVFVGRDDFIPHNGKKISSKEYILEYIEKHRNRVKFIDAIYEKASLNYVVYKAEACVLPSRMDNLPNTGIEAMALGKIIIGTNGASFEQLIDDGVSGYLCERDEPQSLLECMNKVMNMTEEQKKVMEFKAKLRTREMDGENIYRQLMIIYEKTLQLWKK